MRAGVVAGCTAAAIALVPAAGAAAATGSRFHQPTTSRLGVVASESTAASRVGRQVLENGGNAVDAAVATVFAAGVARPQSCGIGGGGFLVLRSARGRTAALDFRETAPAAFRPDSLAGPGLHEDFTGHLTVGVPGTVAGMDAALRRYGTLSLRRAVAPAERLARHGFRVPASLSAAMRSAADRLRTFPTARGQYLAPDGAEIAPGSTLRQPEYAASLRRIMRGGARAFYRGTIARRIVKDMQAPRPETRDPGLLTLEDFAAYRAVWRPPVHGTYRGRTIVSVPAPSSGGIAVVEMLNILSAYDLARMGPSSADALHLIAEVQKIAWADRNTYVGDPDYVNVPTDRLISKLYAGARTRDVNLERASSYGPGLGPRETLPTSDAARFRRPEAPARPDESTTHVSVVDRRGTAVAVTCTIEQEFGSAVVAPGTGFLLNNELTDFGAPGTANEPGPRKRPRSSMSPTIVVEPSGRPSMVLGGAGGARIIMGVVLPIINQVDWGRTLAEAVDAERIDARNGQNGALVVEDARIAPEVLAELERRGHVLQREGEYARRPRINAAGIEPAQPGLDPRETRTRMAVSDPRTDQAALAQRPARRRGR